MDNYMFN